MQVHFQYLCFESFQYYKKKFICITFTFCIFVTQIWDTLRLSTFIMKNYLESLKECFLFIPPTFQASFFFLVYFQLISSFFCPKLCRGLHQCLSLTRIGYKCGSTLSLLIGVMGFGIVWWTTFCPCKVHIHEFKFFGMPSLAFLGFQALTLYYSSLIQDDLFFNDSIILIYNLFSSSISILEWLISM